MFPYKFDRNLKETHHMAMQIYGVSETEGQCIEGRKTAHIKSYLYYLLFSSNQKYVVV